MKRNFIRLGGILVLSGSILFTSCIGSFSLFNKLLAWNQTIDNKFVNELVFFALWVVPAYEVAIISDALVINSIEFWSGDNPVAEGIVKEVQGEHGIYTVETLKNGYHIENEKGETVNLIYDKDSNTWNAVANGNTSKLITFEGNDKAIVYLPDGKEKNVELNQKGAFAFHNSVENAMLMSR